MRIRNDEVMRGVDRSVEFERGGTMNIHNLQQNYKHTLVASYLGYITQAIVNNFAPLLFLTLQSTYAIPLERITLLITINFLVQLLVDMLSAKFIDKIGYRVAIVTAHISAALGLAGLGIFPEIFANPYSGILLAVVLYAIGGGLIEVLISPIVEACPTENKEGNMSLLHSFYCWGSVLVILLTTLFFSVGGISHWNIVACGWAIIPFLNAIYFTQVPIQTLVEEGEGMPLITLAKKRIFWVFVILMVCAGASELAMSQWASAFAESGLGVTKAVGDLAGPCLFAVLMGISRVLYAKFSARIDLLVAMAASGVLCIGSYLVASLSPWPVLSLIGCALCGLSVGILWPGTFSLAAKRFPKGGTGMFALFALAGDLGCSSGPTAVGFVSGIFDGQLKQGLLVAIVFPALLLLAITLVRRNQTTVK